MTKIRNVTSNFIFTCLSKELIYSIAMHSKSTRRDKNSKKYYEDKRDTTFPLLNSKHSDEALEIPPQLSTASVQENGIPLASSR